MPFEKPDFQPRTMPRGEFFVKARVLTGEEMEELGAVEKRGGFSPENIDPKLTTFWRNPETGNDQSIEINLEEILKEQKAFYRDRLGLEIDDREVMAIWNKNYAEIKSEVEKYGYDSVIIVPEDLPIEADVNMQAIETMDEGVGKGKVSATKYWVDQQGISTVTENKYRIVLVHWAQNLSDHPLLKVTKGKSVIALAGIDKVEVESRISGGQELSADFKEQIEGQEVKIKSDGLSLEEYEIFQRMYFEKTRKHLDESGWTWLINSRSGARVVRSRWHPDGRRLRVYAHGPGTAYDYLGLRLSRSFSN